MEKFKKYWVCHVNNYIVGASYSGKKLKERHVVPSFRKFSFIRSEDELEYFTKHRNISNIDLVKIMLDNDIKDPQPSQQKD